MVPKLGVSYVYNKGLGMQALLSVSTILLHPGIRQPACIMFCQLHVIS